MLSHPAQFAVALIIAAFLGHAPACAAAEAPRPNILFCIADDWGYPHAGAYDDPVVKTPAFDRLAREGVLFQHAYVSSPSCTPSRGAILTGQYHWRLEGAGNLHSVFPDKFTTYPEILEQSGYVTGSAGKAWGPGRTQTADRPMAGRTFRDFRTFLEKRDGPQPFCFWLGSSDPHRPYDEGSGEASGMDLSQVRVPAAFPDDPLVRSDVADYYFEVERFDTLVGDALAALEEQGLLERTLVIMTGDHGMPFPRGKSNCYDLGERVPLAMRCPKLIPAGRTVEDLVSMTDLAPTYLELAGVSVPDDMTGRSLVSLLQSEKSGRIDPAREYVLFGKERHVPAQEAPDMGGYPIRAIRTYDWLYIHNHRPDRWPNGTPNYEQATLPGRWFADTDNGPTKSFMIENADRNDEFRRLYELSFGKRPAEELYDLKSDPDQMHNVADDPANADIKHRLSETLSADLRATGDPRELGHPEVFENQEFLGSGPRHPSLERQ